jgi:hypothetical protein
MAGPAITRAHRALIGVVAAGAFIIAGIGFTGSYAAVRTLALHKGFGDFSYVFPIGVDVGIAVLLALDLVLTWLRIPFPLLRQTAWLLTGATVVFNAASSWGDPLAMGMHAIIPVLFVVVVEAARHAIGRMADITADRHMESVRLMRWLLSPVPTFRLWRRMKLWELRSYDEVVRLEQNRLVYRTHLRAQYGRSWRRQAPIETLLPLKLAKYGVPLDLDIVRSFSPPPQPIEAAPAQAPVQVPQVAPAPAQQVVPPMTAQQPVPQQVPIPAQRQRPQPVQQAQPPYQPVQQQVAQQPVQRQPVQAAPQPLAPQPPVPDLAVKVLANLARNRHRGPVHEADAAAGSADGEEYDPAQQHPGDADALDDGPEAWFAPKTVPEPDPHPDWVPPVVPQSAAGPADDRDPLDVYFEGLLAYREAYNHDPAPQQLAAFLYDAQGVVGPSGRPINAETLNRAWPLLQQRYAARFDEVAQ